MQEREREKFESTQLEGGVGLYGKVKSKSNRQLPESEFVHWYLFYFTINYNALLFIAFEYITYKQSCYLCSPLLG